MRQWCITCKERRTGKRLFQKFIESKSLFRRMPAKAQKISFRLVILQVGQEAAARLGTCYLHIPNAASDLRNQSVWRRCLTICVLTDPPHDSNAHSIREPLLYTKGFRGGLDQKEFACRAGDPGSIPGLGVAPGGDNGNHSSTPAWRIPQTEEPSRLQSTGSQRIRHEWANNTHTHTHTRARAHTLDQIAPPSQLGVTVWCQLWPMKCKRKSS